MGDVKMSAKPNALLTTTDQQNAGAAPFSQQAFPIRFFRCAWS